MAQAKDAAAPTLEQLIAQQEEIARQIEQFKRKAREEGLEQIKNIMVQSGLTPRDLLQAFTLMKTGRRSKSAGDQGGAAEVEAGAIRSTKAFPKLAQKYRDPATGDGWSGRGLQPRWLKAKLEAGAKLEDFRVE